MLDIIKINKISLKYNCWISNNSYLYYRLNENGDFKRVAKFYYKEATGYYHITDINKIHYEGNTDLDILFQNFKNKFKF